MQPCGPGSTMSQVPGGGKYFKEIGVDFFGFRASPAGTDRNWTSGVIRVFLIGGDGNDDGK